MWFFAIGTLWRSSRISQRRPARPRPCRDRLTVEALEDRSLPSFLAPMTGPGGGYNLFVADFSRDGRADVAVVSSNNKVTVSLSNGDGTFTRASITSLSVPGTLESFGFADVNGDGNLDLYAGSYGKLTSTAPRRNQAGDGGPYYSYWPAYQTVWLGKGDGTFGNSKTASAGIIIDYDFGGPTPFLPWNPTQAFADFNHDGVLDQVTVNGSSSVVSVSLGIAGGTYQAPVTYAAGPGPASAVAVGDFNGDGLIDVVVVNSASSSNPTLSVLFNDGSW
jgi:hypothetical protein